jgi:hypothetical protein
VHISRHCFWREWLAGTVEMVSDLARLACHGGGR